MIETEFVKGLQVVINTMRRLINENETYMDETCNRKRLSKDRQRLKTLLMSGRDNAVQGEPMEDAYLDVSNYGIMATIVKNGKWGK